MIAASSVAVFAAFLLIGALFLIGSGWLLTQYLVVCEPNELVVLSGRARTASDGTIRGYRVLMGGRGMKTPLIESEQRLSRIPRIVFVEARNVFASGGARVDAEVVATYRITQDARAVHNAVERFIGQEVAEIDAVASNTLEGHLRATLAALSLDELRKGRLGFARKLRAAAEADMAKLGLEVLTLSLRGFERATA